MGAWRRRLAELLRWRRLEADAAEELAAHVEQAVAAHVAGGCPPDQARRRVAIELGSVEGARARIADARTGATLAHLGRELRHAARLLRRAPGLTTVSAATIAVGVGATTVLFALVSAVILRPLPYPDAARLVRIVDVNAAAGVDRAGVATGNLHDWRRRATAFSGLAGHYAMGRTLEVDGTAEVVVAAQVTEDFFAVAGVPPSLGRTFTPDEVAASSFSNASMPTGTDGVVVIGHGLWRTRFGGDPSAVGRTVLLERRPFRIVGVMPEGFALPDVGVQLWMPWRITADSPRDQHYVGATARLAPGVTLATAAHELTGIAASLDVTYPATNQGWSVRLLPLHDEVVGTAGLALWLLLGAVGLLLVVACANIALLTTLRGVDRRPDAAVRLALGAEPARLVREFLMESLLVAGVGGALGAALAMAVVQALPSLTPDLPRVGEVVLDARALGFATALTALAAFLAGWPQATARARLQPAAVLAGSARMTGDGRHRLRDAAVVAQVALAVVLLVGAGLLVRSVRALGAADAGFDPTGVLVAPVFLDSQAYSNGDRTRTYYRTLFERLAALPGVTAVGGATTVPTSPLGPAFERPVWPSDGSTATADRTPASVRIVTSGYATAIGLRVVAGRTIDDHDTPTGPRVVVVNETLARRLWPRETAVGRRLTVDYSTNGTYPYEVIGVVGDLRFGGPRSAPTPEIYLAHAQRPYLILNVVVKASGDPRRLVPAVREVLHAIDPQKPAHGLHALSDLVGATYARDRLVMVTLVGIAGAATFLAVLSVYGVLAHRVRERRREIGIRIALGARAGPVAAWVAGTGLRLMGLGLAIGLAAARTLASVLDGVLFGVQSTDAVTTTAVSALVVAVGLVAAGLPSWRAARIDPLDVLRRP